MKNTRPFDAIIFDHDGTLIDTESSDMRACQLLYAELDLPFNQAYWAQNIAGSMTGYEVLFTELSQQNSPSLTKEGLWQRLRQLWQITDEWVEPVTGVKTLLPQLHAAGYPLAVASSSDCAWLVRWLTKFDLIDYFQVLAGGDNVAQLKPAPDVYLWAAAQLGVKPERCLVFEDTLFGVHAAKSAGMTVIAVPSFITCNLDFSQADRVIEGFEQVTPEWVANFNHNFI